jgi:hypothetical protein
MAHDHNGRVGPPRCEECNAPLNSDERRLDSSSTRFLCLECQFAYDPFPQVKRKRWAPKRRHRPLVPLLASADQHLSCPLQVPSL